MEESLFYIGAAILALGLCLIVFMKCWKKNEVGVASASGSPAAEIEGGQEVEMQTTRADQPMTEQEKKNKRSQFILNCIIHKVCHMIFHFYFY